MLRCATLFIYFQTNSILNPFQNSCLLVVPTKDTHRIDDLIDLLQGSVIHMLVTFIEVGFDLHVCEAAIYSL